MPSTIPLKSLAGYVLERRLGRGGIGDVWLGRHARTGQHAAVKLLPQNLDAHARRLFEVERKAAARLDHPHIVPVFEHGSHYLITAYVRGMDLRQRIRSPMALPEALRVARALASALAHAHARRVIHRDVKPSNVLLDERGYVYLADFGVAALLDEPQLVDGVRAGTRGFMAPEQSLGRAELASDQYGLGRTLLAMLVGERSLDHGGDTLAMLPAGIPASVRGLLQRCLAEQPENRFVSMDELGHALDRLALTSEALSTSASTPKPRRSSDAFAWARAALARESHGSEIGHAEHSLRSLSEAGLVDRSGALAAFETMGIADLGFSIYACEAHLGPLDDPLTLSRASEVVVLLHGLFCDRRFFHRVALELCRRNASLIVVAPDLNGQGASPYAPGCPTLSQAAPRSTATVALGLLGLLGFAAMPTVLFGHSYAANALLEIVDDELPADTQRVVLTPALPYLVPSYRWALFFTGLLSLLCFTRGMRKRLALISVRAGSHIAGGRLSDELVELMAERMAHSPHRVVTKYIDGACKARPAQGALNRCIVVCVPDDPAMPEAHAQRVIARLRIPSDRLFMLASGGHYPVGAQAGHPEWTARNIHDLCCIVDGAFELPAVGPSDPTLPQTDDVQGAARDESGSRVRTQNA